VVQPLDVGTGSGVLYIFRHFKSADARPITRF
jgi:hypothetical protein